MTHKELHSGRGGSRCKELVGWPGTEGRKKQTHTHFRCNNICICLYLAMQIVTARIEELCKYDDMQRHKVKKKTKTKNWNTVHS